MIGGRSERADAFGIFFALHQEHAGIGKSPLEKRAKEKSEGSQIFLVAKEGAIGNAPADEKYRNAAATSLPQKVRPDFGFKDDDHGRLNTIERSTDTERPIQREVNDRISERH